MGDDRFMNSSQWAKLEAVWREVVGDAELPLPEVEAGTVDPDLRSELESLRSCVADAQAFFGRFAVAVDAAASDLGTAGRMPGDEDATAGTSGTGDSGALPGSDHSFGSTMDPLARLQSALSDRYRVGREIGAGGAATVYLALDLKHDRRVALKLLRPELGALLGVERFLSEIKVTANLQHPHLLPLYDSGDADGQLFYVMPFVEGMSLRDRLEREKQLPVDEAVRITVAIAGALEYAHRHDVVHRDLKPENILLHEGEPLVGDFGIALAISKAGGQRLTETGFSPGTPQYMSPEQASGDRTIDARSDIYSLAAVLYEMLTGEPPHSGPTVQAILARMLTDAPRSVRVMRATVPLHVDAALQKALSRLPADRFGTAQEFAEALLPPRTPIVPAIPVEANGVGSGKARLGRLRILLPWLIAAAVTAVVLQVRRPQPASPPAAQFPLMLPPGVTVPSNYLTPVAVSPDGRTLAFLGDSAGITRVYVQAMSELTSTPLPGTGGAVSVFFSWDGASIGLNQDGRLKRIPVTGGAPASITTFTTRGGGASWGRRDVIVFVHDGGLWSVSAHGGEAQPLMAGGLPSFLPDGNRFLFIRRGSQGDSILLGSLDGSVRDLGLSGQRPMYVDGGYVLFNSAEGNLLAVPFDLRRGTVTGPPRVVLESIRTGDQAGTWNAATGGTLVALLGANTSRLVRVAMNGSAQPLSDEARVFRRPRVSPDGSRIAVEVSPSGGRGDTNIWMFDRSAGTLTPFTAGGGTDPVWTPDGKRLTWVRPGETSDVVWQASDGSGDPERIASGQPTSWDPDGHTLILNERFSGGHLRISAVQVPGASTPVLDSPDFDSYAGRVSPDGRWIAYQSTESGPWEVYVRPFRRPGGKVKISSNSGAGPVWSRSGRGLDVYYRDGSRKLVAVSLDTSSGITVLSTRVLFEDPSLMFSPDNFDVLPGDSGFIWLQPAGPPAQFSIIVNLIDWLRSK